MNASTEPVSARVERVTIPTYGVGAPQKNPLFLEKRVYQGSSGAVYPYPVIERVEESKADKQYTAIFLENRYLLIMLLPEIGGRVQMALDKTNDYHFVYYNRVIKPALVGLTGPWISGGIEFNWPQHHRPSTFDSVDYRIEEHADGSKTVWMGEIERMFHTKSTAGLRLYPDCAYLEINVQICNRTPLPQTFLWWANPAVHVNDDYQSIFPPDVFAVLDHGKRAVSTFPIATGTYYKVNYSPGTDISRYKNIPVPTSYMAYHSNYDFLGCYDHGRQAGMLHVANHHLVPGKKQWTWGNSNFGQTWDRQLTDADGPYIELMCGAFTDNQPDFSWLQPGEEKRFSHIFMPFKRIGGVKNASKDAAINLEIEEGAAQIGVYLTRPRTVTVTLVAAGETLYARTVALSPEEVLQEHIVLPAGVMPQQVTLRVQDEHREFIAFTPLPDEHPTPPDPATPAPEPAAIDSNEALYLHGLHLEQYRHATYDPEPYYQEALRRDPHDSRCNNALGLRRLRQGNFSEAEAFFRTAVQSLTRRNPNPYDGEPYYNLGLALRWQGRIDEAFDAFYKAVWNAAWQDAGYFELAAIAATRNKLDEALDLLERCLDRNRRHSRARLLRAAILRRTGQVAAATAAVSEGLALDPLHYGMFYEEGLQAGLADLPALARHNPHTLVEIALEYAHAGLYDEAEHLLGTAGPRNAMAYYYQGWVRTLANGRLGAPADAFACGAAAAPDTCFPNELECVPALAAAMAQDPHDARAPYYLGTFYYAHRAYEQAISLWEQAAMLDPDFATVHRNLGLAYMNKRGDAARARDRYARAFALDPADARVFFELDQLDKKLGRAPAERLANLVAHRAQVDERDDLTVEYVLLLNLAGRHAEALDVLMKRTFHPWEGGEGKVSGQYLVALVELAKAALEHGDGRSALDLLERAYTYPDNLAEGKLAGAPENHIHYYCGQAYALLGDDQHAREAYFRATHGTAELSAAMYYNDQPPDRVLYQALAYAALGEPQRSAAICQMLINYGETPGNNEIKIDYFAVSLPDFLVFDDDLTQRQRIHCHYMAGLGYLGIGELDTAQSAFDAVLASEPTHLGAATHRRLAEKLRNTALEATLQSV